MSASTLFFIKKAVSALLIPPGLPFFITAIGLLLLRHKPRTGKTLAWSGLILWLLLSTPYTTGLLVTPLERYPAVTTKEIKDTQAIVILGGGMRYFNEEFEGGATVNRLTLERLRYGARLARQTKIPVLVTGGAPTGYRAEGVLMHETLKEDFGIHAKWVEASAFDTADNARYSARILNSVGISNITLVTHAAHMRRAVAEFETAGLTVIPAPMGFMQDSTRGEEFFDYLPSMTSAYTGWYAMHEWWGIAAQKIRFARHSLGVH